MKILKIFGFILLGAWQIYAIRNPHAFGILDGVNVLFHEAGHIFFMPFGQYLHVWGGTMLQLFIPLAIGIAFLRKQQQASAAVMFWWFGENFLPIARYIQDARAQTLPFVGGEEHDWGYLLNVHRLIRYDLQIGRGVWTAGMIIMFAALIFGIFNVFAPQKPSSAKS